MTTTIKLFVKYYITTRRITRCTIVESAVLAWRAALYPPNRRG